MNIDDAHILDTALKALGCQVTIVPRDEYDIVIIIPKEWGEFYRLVDFEQVVAFLNWGKHHGIIKIEG